jgi:predicted nucleic acid-binding Zn ribbon protein
MNCPECGSEIFADQQYCRSCGAVLTGERRPNFNLRFWGLAALACIFSGLLIAMGAKMWDVKWLLFAGLVLTFTGMFGIAAFGMLQQTRPRKAKQRMSDPLVRTPELQKADTTNKLPPIHDDIEIPSVVDDTTELLKVPSRKNPTSRD